MYIKLQQTESLIIICLNSSPEMKNFREVFGVPVFYENVIKAFFLFLISISSFHFLSFQKSTHTLTEHSSATGLTTPDYYYPLEVHISLQEYFEDKKLELLKLTLS